MHLKSKLKTQLKEKKLIFASWGVNIKTHYQCMDWKPTLQDLFKNLILFSSRDYYFNHGRELMNKKFLDIVQKEKPDYILFALNYDEFDVDTLFKIRQISPETAIINFFGDDNWRYDDWSRHYAMLSDYLLPTELDHPDYEEDGIDMRKVFFFHGTNNNLYKPIKIEKKYDVSFTGGPIRDRPNYMKFLKENKINVKLFGLGWDKYPDLKDIYGGITNSEEYVRVINQTKINVNFSKSALKEKGRKDAQFKGRILEVPAAKSFILTEDFYGSEKLPKIFQKTIFKNKEELLKKVKYYLKHEDEREKIASELYNDVQKTFTWEAMFINFFSKISNKNKPKDNLYKLNKKILSLTKQDLVSKKELEKKLKDIDFITFKTKDLIENKYRNYFQAYSLEKSKKQISCCDYYTYSNILGDYLLLMTKKAFKTISKEQFLPLLDINQLMVTKDYFLKNYEKFKTIYINNKIDFLEEENTIFVSIPLVKIKNKKIKNLYQIRDSFRAIFIDKLQPIYNQKKFSLYPLKLLIEGITGKKFILKYLINYLSDKTSWYKARQ